MIHKLGHITEINNIEIEDSAIRSAIENYLSVLDNAYGENRDIDSDLGGYVLYCDIDTRFEELKGYFDYTNIPPEWVNDIDSDPYYVSVLYILSSDYAVVVVMAKDEFTKKENKPEV